MSMVQDSYFPASLTSASGPSKGHVMSLFPSCPYTAPFQVLQCPGGRWAGRAELFFVSEGAAAALSNQW